MLRFSAQQVQEEFQKTGDFAKAVGNIIDESMGASGGAHQSSPEQPQGNPVGMALQVQQLEQQRRMNDAQIALAEAQAEKAGANSLIN